jgi:hypothetical protein
MDDPNGRCRTKVAARIVGHYDQPAVSAKQIMPEHHRRLIERSGRQRDEVGIAERRERLIPWRLRRTSLCIGRNHGRNQQQGAGCQKALRRIGYPTRPWGAWGVAWMRHRPFVLASRKGRRSQSRISRLEMLCPHGSKMVRAARMRHDRSLIMS